MSRARGAVRASILLMPCITSRAGLIESDDSREPILYTTRRRRRRRSRRRLFFQNSVKKPRVGRTIPRADQAVADGGLSVRAQLLSFDVLDNK